MSSNSAGDWLGGLNEGNTDGMDLKKLTRKETSAAPAEGIIDGVTHDSIDKFVKSRKSPGASMPETPPSFLQKVKAFFNR